MEIKMKNTLEILLFLSIFSFNELWACECSYPPESFDEYVRANHIIFSGTVLEQIEIPKGINDFYSYNGLTVIKVDKWYQNQMESDTIYYANGQGHTCISSVRYLKGGEQVIIKATEEYIPYLELTQYYSYTDKKLLQFKEKMKNRPVVGYTICDVGILKVKNEMVVGNITKNYLYKSWRQANRVRKISKKWAEKIESKYRNIVPKYQKWGLKRFSRLMRRRWNSI